MPEPGMAPARLRIVLGVLVVALAPLLFLGGPDNHSARSFKLAWQLGHPLLFFCLVGLFATRVGATAWRRLPRLLVLGVAGSVLAGGAIEWLQQFAGRESSWSDLRLDVLGAVLAAAWFGAVAGTGQWWLRRAVIATVLSVLMLLDVRPLLIALIDEYNARRAFPVLADFSSPYELGRWASEYPMEIVPSPDGSPGNAVRAMLAPAAWPGLYLRHFPRDWSSYAFLRFRILVSSDTPVPVTCMIDDVATDLRRPYFERFNIRLDVEARWQLVELPMALIRDGPRDRQLDVRNIAAFGCIAMRPDRPLDLYLRDVTLASASVAPGDALRASGQQQAPPPGAPGQASLRQERIGAMD